MSLQLLTWLQFVRCVAVIGLAGTRLIREGESHTPQPAAAPSPGTLRAELARYGLAAAVIVAAGVWMPLVGERLVDVMGWSDSRVGTLLVALATSVPEAATTLAAVRAQALDMAVARLRGSNLFDLLILAIDDRCHSWRQPLFAGVGDACGHGGGRAPDVGHGVGGPDATPRRSRRRATEGHLRRSHRRCVDPEALAVGPHGGAALECFAGELLYRRQPTRLGQRAQLLGFMLGDPALQEDEREWVLGRTARQVFDWPA